MTTENAFRDAERVRNTAWKQSTAVLPAEARAAAPYIGKDGLAGSRALDFCVPRQFASHNLLDEVRDRGLSLFAELEIPWHAGIDADPSNHLLSSQVQSVNALGPMVTDPARIQRSFGRMLDVAEVLTIEPGRYLTFEYIGPVDYFGESPGGPRIRGAHCTSVDAAFLYRTAAGRTELALVEWKYTEEYRRTRKPDPAKDAIRWARYGEAWAAQDCPVRSDIVPFEDMLDEPFYQLMRQQLLAHRLEQERVLGVDRVRVVHVLNPANVAYQQSLTRASHRLVGDTVDQVWTRLLRQPTRFSHLDPAAFLDPLVTSDEYVARYG
jgi:hypothetical protein